VIVDGTDNSTDLGDSSFLCIVVYMAEEEKDFVVKLIFYKLAG